MTDSGVHRVSDGGVTRLLALKGSLRALELEPGGAVWVSAWDEGVLRVDASGTRRLATESYEALAVLSAQDAWAITGSHGDVVHYDGAGWSKVRGREELTGHYSDNKLLDIVVHDGAVWVATWNGVWRGKGSQLDRLDPPAGVDPSTLVHALHAGPGPLIASYGGDLHVRGGHEGWSRLAWPLEQFALVDVGGSARVVFASREGASIATATLSTGAPKVTRTTLAGTAIHDVALDDRGRAWVATDHVFAVVDPTGVVARAWAPGTLEAIVGEVSHVAVIGDGPAILPPTNVPRLHTLEGRLMVVKSAAPLANAEVALCPRPAADGRCAGPFVVRARTNGHGMYRLEGVPEGAFRLGVPRPAIEACQGSFSVMPPIAVVPAKHCEGVPVGGVCKLPDATVCRPFEMPPGHGGRQPR